MKPAAGRGIIHAITMLPATPQRTADTLLAAPTPVIAPVMVWVVDTGTPNEGARRSGAAPAVSAQKPWTGFKRVILEPIVRTMRQPPTSVPKPMAIWQD